MYSTLIIRDEMIDLNGPMGNAFYILGRVKSLGRSFGYSPEQVKEIQEKMMSGDYDHLLEVFRDSFEGLVELV
ncbi:MAG: hypothetical protein RLZZ479_903 [Bacteroidota bacterium]|jgi:hypothetical protein